MAETLPPQPRRRRGKRKRTKIPSPQPPSFLPDCFNARAAGATAALGKEKRIVALDPPNPFTGNAKELPKFELTIFLFSVIITIDES